MKFKREVKLAADLKAPFPSEAKFANLFTCRDADPWTAPIAAMNINDANAQRSCLSGWCLSSLQQKSSDKIVSQRRRISNRFLALLWAWDWTWLCCQGNHSTGAGCNPERARRALTGRGRERERDEWQAEPIKLELECEGMQPSLFYKHHRNAHRTFFILSTCHFIQFSDELRLDFPQGWLIYFKPLASGLSSLQQRVLNQL